MKHLKFFKTKEEYEAFRSGGQYLIPNVSFIESEGTVINDAYRTSGKDDDVIFLDLEKIGSFDAWLEAFANLIHSGAFINKTTYYLADPSNMIRVAISPLTISYLQLNSLKSDIKYVSFNKTYDTFPILLGSGVIMPEGVSTITIYELLEMAYGPDPVELVKSAEVSREVVEQWMGK